MSGPLEGFTVLELATGLCGPFAALRLADLGADVVKVEPLTGDPVRGHGPPFAHGAAAAFNALNRGKRSIAVDLASAEGSALVRRLAAEVDVVIESFGPGGAEALGLGDAELRAANPGLVYCAISPYGEDGPWRNRPGAELVVQAASDYWASVGRLGEPPVRVGADIAGLNTAVFAAQAVNAALFARLRHPQRLGQRVSVSLLGTLLHMRGVIWAVSSNPDQWYGFHNDTDTRGLENGYRTADGRIYFALRRANSEDYDTLMVHLGLVDYLDDPRFGNFGRDAAPMGRRQDEAKEVWEQGFAPLRTEEVVQLILDAGGDAVPLTDYPMIVDHPQTAAIGALVDAATPDGGTFRTVGNAWRFSGTPVSPALGAPPRLGQHTDDVLAAAGLDGTAIAELRAAHIVL